MHIIVLKVIPSTVYQSDRVKRTLRHYISMHTIALKGVQSLQVHVSDTVKSTKVQSIDTWYKMNTMFIVYPCTFQTGLNVFWGTSTMNDRHRIQMIFLAYSGTITWQTGLNVLSATGSQADHRQWLVRPIPFCLSGCVISSEGPVLNILGNRDCTMYCTLVQFHLLRQLKPPMNSVDLCVHGRSSRSAF